MAFSKKELKEALKQMELQGQMQEKLQNSADEYAKHLQTITELQRNISHIQAQVNEYKKLEKEYNDQITDLLKDRKSLDEDELKIRKKQITEILKKRQALRNNKNIVEAQLEALERTNEEYVEAAKNVNKLNLGLKEGLGFLRQTPGLIKKGYGKLKGYGVFEMDKSIRMAGVEMGKMASVGTAFGKDIIKASTETQSMGMHVKDLAKMQATYSSELGRSVMLSEEGFDAMSQMASGTMLGADGAASLAAEMDRFNISAIGARDIVEDTTNMAEKMGLNASKVIKSLQNNLKMANKYQFKGGVNGMVKMVAQAEKFKMSMETTAQFADKLFNIEGAVEMAASLNTMGGEWAKLGDPMKLMYQARNDMEGLQSSVIDATAGMADFNKETGEFSFSGLELSRMRELEKITGISAEQMAEMAKAKAKFAKINAQMGLDVSGDPEMKEFIENSAVFNKESGQFEIKLSGKEGMTPIRELNSTYKDMIANDAKSLKERAENSQSFDEQLLNMIENAKTLLLPLLEGLNAVLPDMISGFKSFMKDTKGIASSIKGVAKTVGDIVGKAIGLFMDAPLLFKAGIALLFGPGKWILSGLSLAKGFMMGTKGMMNGSGGGLGSKTSTYTKSGKGLSGKMGRFGKGMIGKGIGVGAVSMIGSMAMDYGRSTLDNENSDAGKAMGVASGALSGAGTGAMIGSVIPVIGTAAGAIIGGLVGGIYSAVEEYGGSDSGGSTNIPKAPKIGDGILADGKITPIDSKDKVFEVSKPGGAFDKARSEGLSTNSTNNSKVHISFDTINVKSDDGVGKINLENDSAFMSMLATKIKEELTKQANGGVLSPNPS